MKIETEFNIGDEVWVIFYRGAVNRKYEVIGPKKINHISVQVVSDTSAYESYNCDGVSGLFSSDDVFKTQEFAITAAEALNK